LYCIFILLLILKEAKQFKESMAMQIKCTYFFFLVDKFWSMLIHNMSQ
jgi:hypothetical protein